MQKLALLLVILFIGCSKTKENKKNEIKPSNKITETVKEPIRENIIQIDSTKTIDSTENKLVIDSMKINVLRDTVLKEITVNKVSIKKEGIKIRPDHVAWDVLTKKYVSSKGKVNYNGLKSELHTIDAYLLHLQKTPPKNDWSKNEKLAYWFNLYNAATIHLIASSYPVKSIRDINGGKPWDQKFIKSGNQIYSLNEIENTIVRPNFNEPRLHVAFNCAAVSCPKLLKGAFFSSKLNRQLTTLANAWVNDPTKNKVTENSIEISKIFEWYGIDFKKGVISFIKPYTTIDIKENAAITYLEYDWKLND